MKPQISNIIAGTMKWGVWGAKFNTQQYLKMIELCIEAGATSFDHADIYGHYTVEEEFGAALALDRSLRSKIQIITKCGINLVTANRPQHQIKSYNTSKSHIEASVDRSLRNLQTDRIDILLLHRPDPLMNPEEIAEAFTALRNAGKVLDFGVSNFSVSQVELIYKYFSLSCNQVELSILELRALTNGILDQCILKKMLPMAWSPLGGGKLFAEGDERSERIIAVATLLGEKYNCSSDQILLAWLFKHPSTIKPVLGTVKAERMKAAVNAAAITLTREEWFLLWRASTGKEVD
jgi:predicted oxidoreductase